MSDQLKNLAIVLYQPQDVVNVASVIRVMTNFGLSDLRLVEPAAWDPYRILGIAHHTDALVDATRRFADLGSAVADCAYIVGTTGRPRQADRRVLTPQQAAADLLKAASVEDGAKVAVLFGREQDGLPNAALDLCHGMLTIPTHPANRSLNLAQAALVIAYELWQRAAEPNTSQTGGLLTDHLDPSDSPSLSAGPLAAGTTREAMFDALQDFLTMLYPSSAQTRMASAFARLRTILMRAAPREPEAAALTNLFRHAARRLAPKDKDLSD